MSDISPIEPVTSSSIATRRDRLTSRLRKMGCRTFSIRNSMQELIAISYLRRLSYEARTELLSDTGSFNMGGTTIERSTMASGETMAGIEPRAMESVADFEHSSPLPNLFEQHLRTTGRVISEQT